MPTKDFLDNGFNERKGLVVRVRWEAISSYHGINLGLSFLLSFWKEGHGQEECAHGRNALVEWST